MLKHWGVFKFMHKQYFINEINKLAKEFSDKNYDLTTLQTSLAVALIVINKFNLGNNYNELMQIFENSKIITVDVIKE